MKPIHLISIVVIGIIGLILATCQPSSNTDKTVCQPIENPFPTPTGKADSFQFNPNIEISSVCSFNGQVSKGEIYKHQITQNLVFCLLPSTSWRENDGWEIVITDTMENQCDKGFVRLVTPPFRGMNAVYIAGWHFRNENNTEENNGSVNAPQEIREFNFVFNQQDYETILTAYNCSRWPWLEECLTAGEIRDLTNILRSRGIMTITNLKLGNLIPNEKAWIELMEFEVKIYLPEE